MHKKSTLLQKMEDEQDSFSAGGMWIALGPQLMGARAMMWVQLQQIELEKATVARTTAKKVEDLKVKVEKAEALFQLYKLGQHMPMESLWDIIKFLLPIYDKKRLPLKSTPSKKQLTN